MSQIINKTPGTENETLSRNGMYALTQSFSRYASRILSWVPRKYSDFCQVKKIVEDLGQLKEEIFRCKLSRGFSEHASAKVYSVKGGRKLQYSALLNEDFVSLDDLDEEVRGLLFKIDSYSLYEKMFYFDIKKHKYQFGDCRERLDRILRSIKKVQGATAQ